MSAKKNDCVTGGAMQKWWIMYNKTMYVNSNEESKQYVEVDVPVHRWSVSICYFIKKKGLVFKVLPNV